MSGAPARDAMLSRGWMELYDRLYVSFGAVIKTNGLPYRLEETNNFTGGAKDATDTFTASLRRLDADGIIERIGKQERSRRKSRGRCSSSSAPSRIRSAARRSIAWR